MSAPRPGGPPRRLLAPEVIQASMMDCGPASLKALLAGFGVSVGYGRLREACSTDVDGTSIDTLEDVAVELGLDAEQVMLPVDHLLLPESDVVPGLLVVQRPHAPTHYVVLWRLHGGWVQLMDPAVGRRWVRREALLREVYRHQMAVPAGAWRDWADGDTFLRPLRVRLGALGVGAAPAGALMTEAARDPTWRGLARLDAATRMAARLVGAGGIQRGAEAERLVARLGAGDDDASIPDGFWTVRPAPPAEDDEERVIVRGAVLVRVGGIADGARQGATTTSAQLEPALLTALKTPERHAWGPFLDALREAGASVGIVIAGALAVAAATVLVQALLLRSVLDLGWWLGIGEHRLGAVVALGVFLVAALALDLPITFTLQRLGRRLEVLLRVAIARKIPRTADAYFRSRPLSDVAERVHSLALLRDLPSLVGSWLRQAFLLALTAGGILWLAPWLGGWVLATVAAAVGLSLVSAALLQERDMRARSHGAVLVRFYLDALLGIASIRAHGAGTAMMREQESVLVQWGQATRRVMAAGVALEAVQAVAGVGLAIGLVLTHVAREGTTGSILLVTYWALQLPVLARGLAVTARQVPAVRNVLTRILEPLDAPEEVDASAEAARDAPGPTAATGSLVSAGAGRVADERPAPTALWSPTRDALATARPRREGVRIEMRGVTVRAGGRSVLEDVDLVVGAGSQVGVVGASGAGKSTLIGLLLGWHRAGEGELLLDGAPLTPGDLARWRNRTAWVDPAVQLYNRRFAENLLFGSEDGMKDVASAIEQADLREVLERLPDGMQTMLGEGGALVSGGEGQRVRLGRAWLRRDVRLVLLDEPFRGLDRTRRALLLERARRHWAGATMLCVTHDVSSTLAFERVLVIDGGRVVEDGDPRVLALDVASRYHQMLSTEQFVRENLWASPRWRRVRVEGGVVVERERPDAGFPLQLVAAELDDAREVEA